MTEAFLRKNADKVLQICTYYLGKGADSEWAFVESFYRAGRECSRVELYRRTRDVCLSVSRVRPDSESEEWLYEVFLGLDHEQTKLICNDDHFGRDVSKLSFLRNG